MLPNSLVLRDYALRSARIWVGVRAATALVLAYAVLPPFPRTMGAALLFVLITTLLCFVDVWRRRERALLGNLGVSTGALTAMSLVPPALAEAGVVALLALT